MKTSYRDLEIYQAALELFFKAHVVSRQLPKYELYELGSQIRRSADSVVTNIVEGYGRRRYPKEWIRFIVFSHASCDETIHHLEKLSKLYPSLKDELEEIRGSYVLLSKRIFKFSEFLVSRFDLAS